MQSLYLGLDGGGTKTAAAIITADGFELGRGSGGGGNIAHQQDVSLAASVRAAVDAACAAAGLSRATRAFTGVCAGMAGYSAVDRRHIFMSLLQTTIAAQSYRIEPDYVTAYWGATCGAPGIAIIAGTGAVAYGRDAQGRTWREDGLGYLLGDHGSGFDLGMEALRHTLNAMDEGRLDPLAQAIQSQLGTQTREGIIQWLYGGFQPARVAALAPVVGALAEGGDAAGRALVALIAARLRHTVARAYSHLQLPPLPPVYPLGGLWNLGEFFRSEFATPHWQHTESAGQEIHFTIVPPQNDAVYGAALLAKNGEW